MTSARCLIPESPFDLERLVGLLVEDKRLNPSRYSFVIVAEGARSAHEVAKLAARHGIEMPVSDAVNAVLEARLTPQQAVEQLLARDPRSES